MPISSIVKKECPICGKIAVEKSRSSVFSTVMIELQCGHTIWDEKLESTSSVYNSIIFSDGKKPREYQIEAIKFLEQANGRVVLADEQGLGKTIEILSFIKIHPEVLPGVIVVPTTVRTQWMGEVMRILAPNGTKEEIAQFMPQVITSGKDIAIPGFKLYIVTFDMLKKEEMWTLVKNDIKLVVIDECQRIKNHLSDRAKAVQRIARSAEHVVAMSGTPIKNNAGEYYTVLNLVRPTMFPNYSRYLDKYCDFFFNGFGNKVGGLKNPELFHSDTKDFILRRTKSEVLQDLPEKERKFYHVDLNPEYNKAYAQGLKELETLFYADDDDIPGGAMQRGAMKIVIMNKLRHLTGYSKTDAAFEFVEEFLESTDRKLTIFTHHIDVMDILVNKVNELLTLRNEPHVLTIRSEMSGEVRAQQVKKFENDGHRILIASTLAAGEGLNLQFSSDAVILERQWNPANEVQAEDRFHRFGQLNAVSITYMIASGTIDEFFTELVESKRQLVAAALDGDPSNWDETGLMEELTQLLVSTGRERWKL